MQYWHPAAYSDVTGHQRGRTKSKHNGERTKACKVLLWGKRSAQAISSIMALSFEYSLEPQLKTLLDFKII